MIKRKDVKLLAPLVLCCACVVGGASADDPEHVDEPLSEGQPSGEIAAVHLAPSNDFNHDGVEHAIDFVRLARSNVPLYDGAFQPIGATVSNSLDSEGHSAVRIQGIESLTTPDGTLYYSWGINGYQSGFIHVADLETRPALSPAASAGNGAACTIRTASNGDRMSYFVRPQPIPGGLKYRGPVDGLLHSFTHYGTPGAPSLPGYTYLSWSWINKDGGGIVRSILQDGEVFYPCAVASIKSSSLQDPGWVRVIYGMTYQGGNKLYGWIIHSHQSGTGPVINHLQCRNC